MKANIPLSALKNSVLFARIFVKFDTREFLKNVEKVHILLKSDKNNRHIT